MQAIGKLHVPEHCLGSSLVAGARYHIPSLFFHTWICGDEGTSLSATPDFCGQNIIYRAGLEKFP